jgi:predicted phage tail protein
MVAAYTTVVSDTISGKTTNRYQRDYIIPLTGAFPVDVRVVRDSADSVSARNQNAYLLVQLYRNH